MLLPLAAGIAIRTTRAQIGTSILILPFQHASRVAEDSISADSLSNGRFDLGVGKGYRNKEFHAFGSPHEQRGAYLGEDLAVLRGTILISPMSVSLHAPFSGHIRRPGSVPGASKAV